jgi:hypothetical protein
VKLLNASERRSAREKLFVRQYRRHAWIVATSWFAGTVMTTNVCPRVGPGITPVFPDAGDTERITVATRNRNALPDSILLEEAVHRHNATAPAVGVAKSLVFGDCFSAGMGMDCREIQTPLADGYFKAQ